MPITNEARAEYAQSAKAYQTKITAGLAEEKNLVLQAKTDAVNSPYKKIELSHLMLEVASFYMAQNALSVEMLGVKNNDVLNEARKIIYRAVIYLEEITTAIIDMPYGDLIKNYDSIKNFSLKDRFTLMCQMGFVITSLEDAFGDNSKWKWSFIELKGRFTVVQKNIIDMRVAAKAYLDPGNPDYETCVIYFRSLTKNIEATAMGYRDKYEIASRRLDDMKNAIRFLLARHKLALALNDAPAATEAKSKAVIWNNKLKADQAKGLTK